MNSLVDTLEHRRAAGGHAREGGRPNVPPMDRPEYPLMTFVYERGPLPAGSTGLWDDACTLLAPLGSDVACEPATRGVRVYGRTEEALESAVKRLRSSCGAGRLRVIGPQVRHWPGEPPREPIVAVRVRVPRAFVKTVRFELARRGAGALLQDSGLFTSVVGAELPLATALGLSRWLEEASCGLGEIAMRLERYEPMATGLRA